MEDRKEKLRSRIGEELVESKVLIWSFLEQGFVLATPHVLKYCIEKLLELILYVGRRLSGAITNRSPGSTVFSIVLNEICAMASESFDEIVKHCIYIIDFFKELVNGAVIFGSRIMARNAEITQSMEQKALALTYSSVRRN